MQGCGELGIGRMKTTEPRIAATEREKRSGGAEQGFRRDHTVVRFLKAEEEREMRNNATKH